MPWGLKSKAKIDIFEAVKNSDYSTVSSYVDAGHDINIKRKKVLTTPLMDAARRGNLAMCQLLVGLGARLEIKDVDGYVMKA